MSDFSSRGTGTATDVGDNVTTGGWDQAMPRFRERWEQQFGPHGARWESYEPRYRYGWELAQRAEHQGKSWFDVQAEARRGWEAQQPDIGWEQASITVRDAYEHATDNRTQF